MDKIAACSNCHSSFQCSNNTRKQNDTELTTQYCVSASSIDGVLMQWNCYLSHLLTFWMALNLTPVASYHASASNAVPIRDAWHSYRSPKKSPLNVFDVSRLRRCEPDLISSDARQRAQLHNQFAADALFPAFRWGFFFGLVVALLANRGFSAKSNSSFSTISLSLLNWSSGDLCKRTVLDWWSFLRPNSQQVLGCRIVTPCHMSQAIRVQRKPAGICFFFFLWSMLHHPSVGLHLLHLHHKFINCKLQ